MYSIVSEKSFQSKRIPISYYTNTRTVYYILRPVWYFNSFIKNENIYNHVAYIRIIALIFNLVDLYYG